MKTTLLAIAVALMAIPSTAHAYFTPEEVLLSDEFFLPPTPRETMERNQTQMSTAAARREREQEAAFSLQRPKVSAPPEEGAAQPARTDAFGPGGQPAFFAIPIMAPDGTVPGNVAGLSTFGQSQTDLELLRTIRLLSRVNQNQQTLGIQNILHSAAGGTPLAPTGAPAVLSAATMLGAIAWTLFRAKRAERFTRT